MSKTLANAPNRSEKTEKKLLKLNRYRANQKELERFMQQYGRLRNLKAAIKETKIETETIETELRVEEIRLCRKTRIFLKDIRKLDEAIDAIPDGTQALILKYRYIDGLGWEAISEELSYSLRTVHYLHNKAVETLAI